MKVQELFRLPGRVAIVTGGSRGLGFAMAEGLAEAGANLVLCGRKSAALEESVEAIRALGVECLAVRCDVAEVEEVAQMVARTVDRFGRIDILVNNAGYVWEEPLETVSLEKWMRTLAVNVTGTFLCSQAAGRQMIGQGGGKIINIASIAGLKSVDPGLSETVPYAAAKGAVVAFTRDLARKWCKHHILVNAIAPGYFSTRMSRYLVEHREPQLLNAIPMRRLGEVDEIKGVAVFLASDAANYITGQVLAVDGGAVA